MHNLILFHLLLVFMTFIWLKFIRCNQILLYMLISFFLPFLGCLVVLVIQLCSFIIKNHERKTILEIDEGIQVEDSLLIRKAELEREVELVPLEEVLIVNNNEIKRQSLISILRDDAEVFLEIVKKALKDEDTETSHYAAASITELKRKFSLLNQELSDIYHENKDSKEIVTDYLMLLNRYINANLLDEISINRLISQYFEVYDSAFNKEHSYELLKNYIELSIKIRDDIRALEYSKLFIELYSNDTMGYKYMLEVYYNKKDYSSFKAVLDCLKETSITIDEKLEDLIGYWMGEELNVQV